MIDKEKNRYIWGTFPMNKPTPNQPSTKEPKNEIKLTPIKSTSPEELYQILNILYSDDGQTVWKVKHKKVGLLRAMIRKERKDEETERKIIKTMNISKSLDHPGILKVFEIYESTEYYNIISELTDGRSLLDELNDTGPFQEKVAANIIYQLLGIINYLHNTKEIIHCRINPNNISLNSLSDDNDYYDIKLMHFNDYISNSNGNKEREQFLNSIKNASNFSLQSDWTYFIEKYNNRHLPMCIHAWDKDIDSIRKYIKLDNVHYKKVINENVYGTTII